MVDGLLIYQKENKNLTAHTSVFFDSTPTRVLSNDITWKIIHSIEDKPKYAREIARELSLNEQSVYYHIKKLLKSGIINIVEEQNIRGASAKKVLLSNNGITILFKEPKEEALKIYHLSNKFPLFFKEFCKDDSFNGYIVVGSPEPHGPFRSVARDGHYAAELSFFLGKCSNNLKNFIIRLDTDIKAERLYNENLILVGGPITNIITSEINEYLPVKFAEPNYWSGLIDQDGNEYKGETDALISKIKNPYDPEKCIIIIAGIRHLGTKSAIIGLTELSEEILKFYNGQSRYASIIKGYDQDGDGKIDHAEIIRSYNTL